MKINKDLADAIMMVSFIILVLVGTSTFDSESTKLITMSILGAITAVLFVLRVLGMKHEEKKETF